MHAKIHPQRLRRRRAPLLLGLVCTVLPLLAAEFSLRSFLPLPALSDGIPAGPRSSLAYEGSIFSRHVLPAVDTRVETRQGRSYRINAKGYRGPDFAWDKPPGLTRIVVYGGSAVFDLHAAEEATWPARAQALLGERLGRPVEVINAGVPGHASFDSVGRLLAEGHRLSPDFALLYNAWNDIKYFRSEAPILRQFRPYLPERDPLRHPTGRLDARLADLSHLYRLARLRFHTWDRNAGPEGVKPRGEIGDRVEPQQLEQFRLNLETFVDLARNAGAVPVLTTQARLVAAGNTEAERRRIAYDYALLDHAALLEAFSATDRAARAVSREKGVALIDASAQLTGRPELFADHIHLTDSGSASLAALVVGELERMIGTRVARKP